MIFATDVAEDAADPGGKGTTTGLLKGEQRATAVRRVWRNLRPGW